MSVDYCHKHHNYYDTDFETKCLQCVDKDIEQSEQKENDQVFFIHDVVSSATKCKHKKYKVRRTYIKWHEFAKRQLKKGYKQQQCDNCKLWFFPSEL
tara:strand:- start:40 stop:330 length:291 start_codon:yes stop_codon:yes gene_type:complete